MSDGNVIVNGDLNVTGAKSAVVQSRATRCCGLVCGTVQQPGQGHAAAVPETTEPRTPPGRSPHLPDACDSCVLAEPGSRRRSPPSHRRRPGGIRSDVTGSLSQVGVHADRESGVCGDALQQRDQPGLVGFVECGEQFGVVCCLESVRASYLPL